MIAYLNGWLEFLIGVPIFLAVMLVFGGLVAWATNKEIEAYKRNFYKKHGRWPDPENPSEWPEPPSMYP